ncbi:MAG: helicase RepA family protein [Chloroflexota bacterium]|nr:helicase RepA family protein [Chloroflexota bacterium]
MSTPFTTVSIADMDAQVFPETEWIVEALIPRGSLVLDAGRPKAGKSLKNIDMLASIALGETFLDRATTQMGTLYVAAEDSFGLVRERVRARFGDVRDAPFHLLPADGSFDQSLRLDDDGTTLIRLSETIDALGVGIVVLDPMRELHAAKENDADEMAMLLRPLRQLAHEKNVTIVLVHHRNKHGQDASTAVRGSSAITGSVDVVMTLDTNNDEEGDLTPGQTVTLRAEGRYGPKQKIVACLGSGLRWQVTNAVPLDTTLAGRIPYLLSAKDEPLDADAIAGALGAKKGGVQNALKESVVKGEVVRLGRGTKSAPYTYAHPRVVERMTKDVETYDASPEMAPDESHDEYSLATQGETPIRHNSAGYIPPEDDESFSPLPEDPDVTKDDESGDESLVTGTVADDPVADAWDILISWAHGTCKDIPDTARAAGRQAGVVRDPSESLNRYASRVFAAYSQWRATA